MNVAQLQPFAPLDGIAGQARSMFGDEDVPVRAFSRRYIPVYGWEGIIAIAACFVNRCEDRALCLRWHAALGGESPAAVVARAVVAEVVAEESERVHAQADRFVDPLAKALFAVREAVQDAAGDGSYVWTRLSDVRAAADQLKALHDRAYADERDAVLQRDIARGEALIANAHRKALEQRPGQADIDTFVDLACAVIAQAIGEE